ncbi:winged helix-turn-helix transcriptional regulator [Limosilactobacillus kribbianus]|uniref:winged helix-turn-helix transcriptional regulator n=1 Tax=Limosilactobacillus kribbianus TaxID=2982695 RepID=UPI0022644A00|nr:transcriptional regulator [Limosilactobacillus kribbianus]
MYQRKTPKKYYCTVDFALDIFGGKWKPRLLCILGHSKALRYGELKTAMEDISDAALLPVLDTISDWAVQHSNADIYSGQHFHQVHFGAFEQHN